jgi:2-polyprenyl-3-methyl-5-hydroxy-6-metoxy-1,4-benzoquinol methylase
MGKAEEINRGYLDLIQDISTTKVENEESEILEAPLPWRMVAAVSRRLPAGLRARLRPVWLAVFNAARWTLWLILGPVILLTLVSVTFTMQACLFLYLRLKGHRTDAFNGSAMDKVPLFVEQYPFHLYPVVCKAFEHAFFEKRIQLLVEKKARFVEMAIGEGSFSSKIFPPEAQVVGLDLNPYSLKKASVMPHVKQSVICDCLQPPVKPGHFDVLLSNNFLHHVTQKEETLSNWSKLADRAIFNESTRYWASSWVSPFLMKHLGFKGAAERKTDRIEQKFLQSLESMTAVDEIVRKDYRVTEQVSYMSERTFFLCAVYSFIMGCWGPPTPPKLKPLFLSPVLRWLTLPLTTSIARLLIRFDQHQERARDAYISYECETQHPPEARTENYLLCTRCEADLNASHECTRCGTKYPVTDGMLFLLPEKMENIYHEYKPEIEKNVPKEHL